MVSIFLGSAYCQMAIQKFISCRQCEISFWSTYIFSLSFILSHFNSVIYLFLYINWIIHSFTGSFVWFHLTHIQNFSTSWVCVWALSSPCSPMSKPCQHKSSYYCRIIKHLIFGWAGCSLLLLSVQNF